MERSGNRRAPGPVRRTTLLYLGVTTGVLALRHYQLWRPLHAGLSGLPVTALAATPDHPELVFAASGGDIYTSADGGTRWRRIGRGPRSTRVRTLLAGPRAGQRLLAGLEPAGIIASDNGSTAWRAATLPPLPAGAVTRLLPPVGERGHLYALAAHHLLASADGGMTWRLIESAAPPLVAVAQHPDAPGTLYAAGPAGLLRTRNGGQDWQRLTQTPITALLVHPNRPRTVIAATPAGLQSSPNAGAHWHPMPGGATTDDDPVVDLAGNAVGEVLLAVTRQGRLLQWLDGRWQPPVMGPTPPVLALLTPSGEVTPWPGVSKRATSRRRRPARKDEAQPEPARGGPPAATGTAAPPTA
ncbi:MAG: hypothetical protein IT340_10460 [Chloroflexi bacterium]|nr:hypothetical protein [Chloroflexota bacterium]